MARVKISEYAAKKLFTDSVYQGVSVNSETDLENLNLEAGDYVVKVDDGTKKRNKLGLVKIGLSAAEVAGQAGKFLTEGYKRVLIEPVVVHDTTDEQYLSCTLVREGVAVLYSRMGGNEVETDDTSVVSQVISRRDFLLGDVPKFADVPETVLEIVLAVMRQQHFSFVEINPFILEQGGELVCLDLAVEVDSAKLHLLPGWVKEHVQENRLAHESEESVRELDAQSTATFSLTVFDENASTFTLLSGGGASLVFLDCLVENGLQASVGNYGEYSGAPSREETSLYTKELLKLMFASKAEKKVFVIAGGVANFTDVTTTFQGIADACAEYLKEFSAQPVMVQVRRGGPRQAQGLVYLDNFFKAHNIPAVVSDPSVSLSQVALDVHNYMY